MANRARRTVKKLALTRLGYADSCESQFFHDADDVNLNNNLAGILATAADADLRDGAEAVRLAESACNHTQFRSFALIDTLAAAYAEASRFDEAVETLEKAIQLADEADEKDAAYDMREKLALYQAERPFHEK